MSTGPATRPPASDPASDPGSDARSGPPVRSAASALSRRLAAAAAGGGDAGAGAAVRRDTGRPDPADDPLLEGMNPPQREAVVHTGSPLLIVAGAGSGKTRVLTHRIAWQMRHQGVGPGQFMAITFTNKAAAEMRERVAALVGRRANAMWVSTFHSMCVRILRREYRHLGLSSTFSIYDADDSRRLVATVARGLDLDAKKYSPRGLLARISAWKNELVSPIEAVDAAATEAEKRTAEVYTIYQDRLQQSNSLDFDDLIGRTVDLLTRFPDVAEYYRRRFRHILVDEYQDTNHAQYMLVRALAAGSDDGSVKPAELCVVGDADQSIYAFRGATIRNIVEFERDYPEARTILLEQNYRSTQRILSAANAVISRNAERRDKRLWTDAGDGELVVGYVADNEHDEAAFVASEIDRLVDAGEVRFGEVAVFYRTNGQSRVFEDVFIRLGLPYKIVGGVRFYERREVRDAMAYLKVLSNPEDTVSLRRILNVPKRGIGDRAESVVADAADRERITFAAALRRAAAGEVHGLATRSQRNIADFVEMMDGLAATVAGGASVDEVLDAILDRSGYRKELEGSEDPQEQSRLENLQELVSVAREFVQDAVNAEGLEEEPAATAESEGDAHRSGRHPGRRPRRAGLARGVPRAGVAGGRRRLDPRRRRRRGHADDAAHREGPRVPGRVRHRLGGRHLPALAGPGRPGGALRGAPPRLRRHHPRPAASLPLARGDALGVRAAPGQPAVAVPRRGARRRVGVAARRADLRALVPGGPHAVRLRALGEPRHRRQRAPVPSVADAAGLEGGADDLAGRRRPRQPRQVRPRHGHHRRRRRLAGHGHDRLRVLGHRAPHAHRRRAAHEAVAPRHLPARRSVARACPFRPKGTFARLERRGSPLAGPGAG